MQPQIVNEKPSSFQQYPKIPAKMQNFNQNVSYKYQKMPTPSKLDFPPVAQNGISFGGKLEKTNGPENANRFDERSIKGIGGSLANIEKVLKEMSKENVELKKEIRDLKREMNGKINGIN